MGGSPKYPFQPFYGGFSPRVSLAYSPAFDSGLLGKVFGNRKSVIRGGYTRIYDRANAVNLVLTPLLGYGFGQPVRCRGAGIDGNCHGANGTDPTANTDPNQGPIGGFRVGVDGNTVPFPTVLASCSAPPSCTASPCTIERPRPVPLPSGFDEKNGSTARFNISGVDHLLKLSPTHT